ncbi:MAG: heterodisulfide reductase subunit [Halanaerobiales bacterium]|nr:heterodisulfide reductase subunit [Halanaerobiales bacterium]
MSKIAVIGGGIAGSAAAVELARAGNQVTIIEKENKLGGNLKDYGCKAVDVCTKCNLCLVDDLFSETTESAGIEILYQTRVNDFKRNPGSYSLGIEREGRFQRIDGLDYIVLATGFTRWSDLETGTPEVSQDKRIIWASELEGLMKKRKDHLETEDPLALGYKPESVVFIQCNGSRSIQEKARYCSRVCCGYSYRMARVLKYFFPEIKITIFFMDLQEGGYLQDISFTNLEEAGINYLNCKPVRVEGKDDGLRIIYEDQRKGAVEELLTQLLVLSEGIHPNQDNEHWSMLFNLQLDDHGFLSSIEDELKTGIFLAGTIKGPKDIAATISDGRNVAYKIINQQKLQPAVR